MTIALQNRLALTHALFISLALGVLTLVINVFTGRIFAALIKDNITEKSGEIVRVIGDQYDPLSRGFDTLSIEAMGMYFVHEGYIITVEDERGDPVWDARSCDMQQCVDVIRGITERMEGRFRLNGRMQKEQFPVGYLGRTIGAVSIETYGPYFYSETETRFLTSINRVLLIATIVLTLFSIAVSIPLARAIARPVNKAGEAARQIARVHVPWAIRSGAVRAGGISGMDTAGSAGGSGGISLIRIPEHYKTRELAELSRSINTLAAELEEAERRQKQLTSDIAHELRTPLTCLRGDIEAMIDGVYEPDRKHLESCYEEIMRLTGLVQDLNTLTSLEWETLELNRTEFDLAKLLRATAEQFRAAAAEKGIEINLNLRESPVSADYDRLKQVFVNILSNAVKYTDRGSVTVTIGKEGERPPERAAAEAGLSGLWDKNPPLTSPPAPPVKFMEFVEFESHGAFPSPRWEVTIADTGIGIPESDLPHIFERFYRSDKSRSRSTGGAGIGLTIAAAIVHAHGGKIGAGIRAGERGGASVGSVFRVIIPGSPGNFPGNTV
jgi:signal transduction histidine kinase